MTDLSRDLDAERRLTVGVVPADHARSAQLLNAFADERAGDGPLIAVDRRNFAVEALEELADARNYLVWLVQILGQDSAVPAVLESLAAVVASFDALRRGDLIADPPIGADL